MRIKAIRHRPQKRGGEQTSLQDGQATLTTVGEDAIGTMVERKTKQICGVNPDAMQPADDGQSSTGHGAGEQNQACLSGAKHELLMGARQPACQPRRCIRQGALHGFTDSSCEVRV